MCVRIWIQTVWYSDGFPERLFLRKKVFFIKKKSSPLKKKKHEKNKVSLDNKGYSVSGFVEVHNFVQDVALLVHIP